MTAAAGHRKRFAVSLPTNCGVLRVDKVGVGIARQRFVLCNRNVIRVRLRRRSRVLSRILVISKHVRGIGDIRLKVRGLRPTLLGGVPATVNRISILGVVRALPNVGAIKRTSDKCGIHKDTTSRGLLLFGGKAVCGPGRLFNFFATFGSSVVGSTRLCGDDVPDRCNKHVTSMLGVADGRTGGRGFANSTNVKLIADGLGLRVPVVGRGASLLLDKHAACSS